MDILKDKKYQVYGYTARYTHVPYYYNVLDEKYVYGVGSNLSKKTSYISHKLKETDTLESLALKYYNNPTLYWAIAYFNDIQDSFISLIDNYQTLKIPHIAGIEFGDER